jgi:hypothetical protein
MSQISFWKVNGEVRAVNCETAAEWLSTFWRKVSEGYPDSDIFNANEKGHFFKLSPERTPKFKG